VPDPSTSPLDGITGNAVPSAPKNTYLAAHDYGMGGIWMLIDAESAQQIERTYPDVKVIDNRPPWLNDEVFAKIKAHNHFDIDAPTGYLLSLRRVEGAG
jgi:hypothetical protein